MSSSAHLDPTHRHDFVLLFDVTDGNPNGDPDAGNLPRVDPETMQGLVTDVALKRKVRNYVDMLHEDDDGFQIYIQNKGIALNDLHKRAYDAEGLSSTGAKQSRTDVDRARAWMCEHFYDVRVFGAVMTTEVNAGQVRGPIQLTFARSIDPIVPLDLSITRVAITRSQDAAVVESEDKQTGGKVTEMGRKPFVPYALYRAHGFYNPVFGQINKCSPDDLHLFWDALEHMWDWDRSASRGFMTCRGLYVFTHGSTWGDAPAHRLMERITTRRISHESPPRRFSDYAVEIDQSPLQIAGQIVELIDNDGSPRPGAVTVTRLVDG